MKSSKVTEPCRPAARAAANAGSAEPTQTEELAVFNAPLSATFVPSNAGNMIKVQLDPIDNDRHMIRLAVEIQRASRKPAAKEGEPAKWSRWEPVHIEMLDPNDPVTLAYVDAKLGGKEPGAGGGTGTGATSGGGGLPPIPISPPTRGVTAGGAGGLLPPLGGERKTIKRTPTTTTGTSLTPPSPRTPAVSSGGEVFSRRTVGLRRTECARGVKSSGVDGVEKTFYIDEETYSAVAEDECAAYPRGGEEGGYVLYQRPLSARDLVDGSTMRRRIARAELG